jgi:hypothetical protein
MAFGGVVSGGIRNKLPKQPSGLADPHKNRPKEYRPAGRIGGRAFKIQFWPMEAQPSSRDRGRPKLNFERPTPDLRVAEVASLPYSKLWRFGDLLLAFISR